MASSTNHVTASDDDWIQDNLNTVDIANDKNRQSTSISDNTNVPITARKLVTSKIVLLDKNEEYPPPKDAIPPDKAHLALKYKLQLRAL